MRVGAVVLAAGKSTRMGGRNKLLASIDGTPVVARVVDAALASRAAQVVVVTGHDKVPVAAVLRRRPIELVHNPDYDRGLSSSLRVGLTALDAAVDAALVCLGDMPWVAAAHLDALIAAFESAPGEPPICVPTHDGERGNPVLWPARDFAELCGLDGDAGGRRLIRRYAERVLLVPIADAAVRRDVDVPSDLEAGSTSLNTRSSEEARR